MKPVIQAGATLITKATMEDAETAKINPNVTTIPHPNKSKSALLKTPNINADFFELAGIK